jgi:hypothetical protein
VSHRSAIVVDEVALNPQPLPPVALLRQAVRGTANSVANAAISARLAGGNPREILREAADEWCGTPWRWPRHWPGPIVPPHPVDPQQLASTVAGPRGGRAAYLVKVTYFQAVWVVEFTLSPDSLLT